MRIMDFGAQARSASAVARSLKEMAKDVSDPTKKPVDRRGPFTTVSGVPVEQLYTPAHIKDLNCEKDLGDPCHPPYTRGIYPDMYRSRLWTMRQFSGFGTAA